MPRRIKFEEQWEDLMTMCAKEKQYLADKQHPKLVAFLTARINELATELGFSYDQIKTREFRAQRVDGRIVGVVAGPNL
jgi:hypothetical protein